jgi:Tfp pilus assembly protein FimT
MELMIVFGILAAVSVIGLAGMNNFRAYTQVQQAGNAFVSDVRTAQNAARNGTLASQVIKPGCESFGLAEACQLADAYAIYFDTELNYSYRACAYTTVAGTQVATCFTEVADMKPTEYGNVKVTQGSQQANCRGILFERLTGNIKSVAGATLSPVINAGECVISVIGDVGNTRTVTFDLVLDEIELNI